MDKKTGSSQPHTSYPLLSLSPNRAEQVNTVLYSIASAVNTTLDLNELYLVIHQSLGSIFDVSNFFIAIVNNEEKTLYFPYSVDTEDDDFEPISDFDADNSLAGLVVTNRKPLLLDSKELNQRNEQNGVWGPVPLIWMGVPLIIREEVIGVIAVQSYTDAKLYSRKDLDLLAAISDQTAIAIDRKRSLENLKKSEKRFRQLFEQSNDAIIIHDRHGLIHDCNTRASEMLGYSKNQLLDMNLIDLHYENDSTVIKKALQETDTRGYLRFESVFVTSGGSQLYVDISASMVDRNDRGVIQGIIRDITRAKKTENLLLKSEEKYRNLFHNAQVGLFRTNGKGTRLLECNDALARMVGYSDRHEFMAHYDIRKIFINFEEIKTSYTQARMYGSISDKEIEIRRKNNQAGMIRFSATFFPEQDLVEGVVVDITEIKKTNEEKISLQKKLEQSKKMEAVGLLAGGVAHDLNNILAGIVSYPELLLLNLPENHEFRRPLETILEAGKRGALIVSDMLTLARSAASVKETCDLNNLISNHLESAETSQLFALYPDITTTIKLNATSSTILCSAVHIKKCLMNLLTNAFEAIDGSGIVTCSTENSEKEIILKISDTGHGIPEEEIDHIFEPFYSQKIMGRSGTGLGLTIVWNTIADHGGTITVENIDSGTCFTLRFPLSNLPVETTGSNREIPHGNGESILIVDDEKQLRDIAEQILTSLGYQAHVAASGEDALDYLRLHKVDLVLLDMLMEPGMNGLDTYMEISRLHPGQKAILVSGFSENETVKAALQSGVGRFIKKPYSIELLSQAVRSELVK